MHKTIKVYPGKVKGSVTVPPSKSLCHRALIAAALSEGVSCLRNMGTSADIEATISLIETLGAVVEREGSVVRVQGTGGISSVRSCRMDCGESGSTLRFMVPIVAAMGCTATFVGHGRLGERPMDVYYKIFDEQHFSYENHQGCLPLTIRGKLQPGTFKVAGNISSQFVTGLLMALPLLEGDSVIWIEGPLESAPYVDLTLEVLASFGIHIENQQYQRFIVKGNQTYHATSYIVEGDYSQAAFWLVAGACSGTQEGLLIQGLAPESAQGDRVIVEIMRQCGARMEWQQAGLFIRPSLLSGEVTVDVTQCPDLVPVMTAAAAALEGTMEITGAGRLRIKESDRLAAITQELVKLGACIEEKKEGLCIDGRKSLHRGGSASSWNDHRIAQAVVIYALASTDPVILQGAESTDKSWPDFWQDIQKAGVQWSEVKDNE